MLESLLGLDPGSFETDVRGRRCMVVPGGAAKYAPILSWANLNDLLSGADMYTDRIQLVREGDRLDRRKFTVDVGRGDGRRALSPPAARRALGEGYSIVLDEVNAYHPPAGELADSLVNAVGERVTINVYVSWSSDQCFTTHWDDHDVLIIQSEGEKEWTVFEPTRLHPLANDVVYDRDESNLKIAWQGVLRKGDVLYLPRGWWHHAKTTGDGSIHMTLGWTRRTGLCVLEHLIFKACELEAFRSDLVAPHEPGYEAFKQEFVARVETFFRSALADGGLEAFWRHHYGMLPMRKAVNLPAALDIEALRRGAYGLQIASLAPQIAVEVGEADFAFEMAGKRWVFDIRALGFVRRLMSGEVIPIAEVAAQGEGELNGEEALSFAFELVNEGLAITQLCAGAEPSTFVTPPQREARLVGA